MSCSSRPLFLKTAIGLAAAALAAIIAEVWLDARAAHEHTGMPAYNNLILLAAFASAMLAPLVWLHGRGQARAAAMPHNEAGTPPAIPAQRHRPEPTAAAAADDITSDTDDAPTATIGPTKVRAVIPAPRQSTATQRGSVYRCDPELSQPVTREMRPAGYVEMVPVKYMEMMEKAKAEAPSDDRTFLTGLGLAAEEALGGNDELAVDPATLDAARRITRRLRRDEN